MVISPTLSGQPSAFLDRWCANLALPKGYAKHRVFFEDEASAIAAGYRPCGQCLKPRHKVLKGGGDGTHPWSILPKELWPRPTSGSTTSHRTA
jgi:hypothetical protein